MFGESVAAEWRCVTYRVEAREVLDGVPTLDPEHLPCFGSEDVAGGRLILV